MIRFHSFIQEEERSRSGKTVKCGKNTVLISPNSDELKERADTWHPDPEQDRKLGGPGANQRAREDRESSPKEDPKDPKKLNPGESYMDFAKRHGYKSSPKKEGIVGKLKRKMGLNNSYDYEGEVLESTVPGKPAERVGALSNIDIPVDEREAAKQRTLAKAAALRKKREEQKEEFEIEEGMTMKDFKANRQKNKRRSASADAEKRGHVGKEWYNSGRKYSPDEAKSSRANMDDEERRTRHRSAVDPDNEDDNNYSADKTKNPKKQRKQAAMGEMMSFFDFMEARRMDKEGVERGGSDLDKSIRASTKERAAKAVEAVKKGDKRVAKYVKKYGTTPSKDTAERRDLKMMHPGSRQAPKEKGKKETPSETQNRRVNATNTRRAKHGSTAKEKASEKGMSNYENDYKKTYGQHKSAWD
jgi:hypothetical protein